MSMKRTSSSWPARRRWAGSITKATHDQWALARRGQAAEMGWLRGQIARIEARLARPLGAKADKRSGLVRGYGSRAEWHAKSRRLHGLKDRLAGLEEDWAAGRVHVVRGGKRLARLRHHLDEAQLTEQAWRSGGGRRGCSWPPTGSRQTLRQRDRRGCLLECVVVDLAGCWSGPRFDERHHAL